MKTLIRALCLSVSLFCGAAFAQDSWSGTDKKMHFGVSFVLGFAAANHWPNEPLKAWGVAMIPGLIKELSDSSSGGTGFSGKDLVANAAGAALGVYTGGWLITRRGNTTQIAYATEF